MEKCSHNFIFIDISPPMSNNNLQSLATPSQPPSISIPNLETARLSVALPRNDDDNAIQQATISQLDPSSSEDEAFSSRITPIKPKLNYTDVHRQGGSTIRVHNLEAENIEIGCKLSKIYKCQIVRKKDNVDPAEKKLFLCANCKENSIHLSCFQHFTSKIDDSKLHRNSTTGGLILTCGKRCFNAYQKELNIQEKRLQDLSDKRKTIPWDKDNVTENSPSSMQILLEWITTEGNYARYRGADSTNGSTKLVICKEVTNLIAKAGIVTERTQNSVKSRIMHLESSFREANDWLNATGQGVTCEKNLREAVLSRCRYYYDLVDVMLDRAATTPLYLKDTSGVNSFDASPLMQKKSTSNRHIEVELSSSSDENSSHEVVEMTSPKNKNHQDGSISKKNKETNPRTPMTLKQLNKAAKKRKIAKSDAIKKNPMESWMEAKLELEKDKTKIMKREKKASWEITKRKVKYQDLKSVKLSLDLAEEVLLKRHKLREKGIEQSEIDMLIPPTFVAENIEKCTQKKRPESSDDSVSSASSTSTKV